MGQDQYFEHAGFLIAPMADETSRGDWVPTVLLQSKADFGREGRFFASKGYTLKRSFRTYVEAYDAAVSHGKQMAEAGAPNPDSVAGGEAGRG